MTIAQDLRNAAINNEQPHGVAWEVMEVFVGKEYRAFSRADDLTHRTFLLFVAEALDGGARVPMSYDEAESVVFGYAGFAMLRTVERHHGIGSTT